MPYNVPHVIKQKMVKQKIGEQTVNVQQVIHVRAVWLDTLRYFVQVQKLNRLDYYYLSV